LTWGISPKQKISAWYEYQRKEDPFWALNAAVSPEAVRVTSWETQLGTLTWTYTATSRLLFEVGVAPGASPDTILAQRDRISGIPIVEQGTSLITPAKPMTYRNTTAADSYDSVRQQSFKASTSYVTGTHNIKVGLDMQRGYFGRANYTNALNDVQYRTNGYVPNQVTIIAPLAGHKSRLNYNLGLYAQDRWTLDRLTIGGGLRFDLQNESTVAFTANPTTWLPNRNTFYPAVENVPNWKDVDPRINASYDLFGNGKTAIKASASRGVEQDSIRYADGNNPGLTVSTTQSRTWVDGNLNFLPDCNLLDPIRQDNRASGGDLCDAPTNLNFGNAVPATFYDPAIMNGWGVRPWNWEFSAGVQHELMPRFSVSFGYFRRIQGNFFVLDNENLGPADFIPYRVTVPIDPLLPTSGGIISDLYDQSAPVVNRNVWKAASEFGKQYRHWNGVDLTVDARLRNGLVVQGGMSTGTTMTDNCDVTGKVDNPSLLYCRQETPFLTQYKGLASYELPWYGVRVAATLQSIYGPQVAANIVYTNANIGTTVLGFPAGRTFRAGQATVNAIEPGSQYGDRLNQIDWRVTKIFNVGKGRLEANFDVYNLTNSDAILTQQNAYGTTWLRPNSVIQPRFVKLSARWDF